MSIGSNIFELRKSKKLTQSQLAEKLNVTEQAVSKWENDICTPDVSVFPVIAKYFGVSIDRIFGFHLETYDEEVKKIIKAADNSKDTYKEIEIISQGLIKYPNSNELKLYLAFSLSIVNRISSDEKEKRQAIDMAVSLCNEVVSTSGDNKQIDDAFHMLWRIYVEIGEYEKAMEAVQKMSADNYYSRIVGISSILSHKKEGGEHIKRVENDIYNCWLAMVHILDGLVSNLLKVYNEPEKALFFSNLRSKLLEVFDEGGADFYATYKIIECEKKAQIYMRLGDREKCISELERFLSLASVVKSVAKSESFNISDRNKYFADISEKEHEEEYFEGVIPERAFGKYDSFLSGESEYEKLKNKLGNHA